MIDKGQWRQFGQDTGETPLLFTRSAMGFLMTTESQSMTAAVPERMKKTRNVHHRPPDLSNLMQITLIKHLLQLIEK